MHNFLFSPGPTHIPAAVRGALAQEPLHHRSQAFSHIFVSCIKHLSTIFNTNGETAVLCSSGTGAMEAAVLNSSCPGDSVLCVEGGKFGRRWVDICCRTGRIPDKFSTKMGKNPDEVEFQKIVSSKKYKAVYLTHAESSSGLLIDIKNLASTIKENSDALVVVDVFASLMSDKFRQDDFYVDIAVCGSQKGLMSPPGLGFVSVSKDVMKRLIKPQSLYWDLQDYFSVQSAGQPNFTPAVNVVMAMQTALNIIEVNGIDNVLSEKTRIASSFRKAIEEAGMRIFPDSPSSAMTVFELPAGISDKDVIYKLEESTGFRIAGGQDEMSGKLLRVAHMGAIEFDDLRRLLPSLLGAINFFGHKCNIEDSLHKLVENYMTHEEKN